ncbi:helix-turn-helix transcriptional regulator [Roseateles sp.]|jgi:prophage regulatory protein|uniref:helix-turn-helix transcriptional regulator n=1 Tax=Roseateles sp. TaxID=1971397 RepID=UPI0037CC312D
MTTINATNKAGAAASIHTTNAFKPEPLTGAERCIKNIQSLDVLQLADALLRIQTVGQATGLSGATIYRKLAAGQFPAPVRLGARCTRWKAADVRAWIQAQGGDQ